ncbi:MAG: MFS transporter [Chloroflexota bacterium]
MKNSFWLTIRHFSHGVRVYLFISAIIGVAYFGVISVLLNLYLLRLGYDTQFIGLANGTISIAFATTSIPAGAIGSRIGHTRAVVLGVWCFILSMVGLPLCEYLPPLWQETGIIITRLLNGAGFALYIVNAHPYLVNTTTSKDRDLAFALLVAIPPVAGFAGNLLAGLLPGMIAAWLGMPLDSPVPYRYPIYLAAILLVPALFALWTVEEVEPERMKVESPPEVRASSLPTSSAPYFLIAALAVTALFRMAGEGATRSFFNVYLDTDLSVSTARIGALYAIGQIIAGPTALFSPMLIRRWGKVPVAVAGTIGIAASMVLMALVPHWAAVGAGFAGVIGMLSITRAVTTVYQMEIVAPEWRGLMSGTVSMAMGIGFTSMALGGGFIIPILGYQGLFLVGAAMVTFSALLFWVLFRVPRGEFAQRPALG